MLDLQPGFRLDHLPPFPWLYGVLILVLVVERLAELRLTRRNARQLRRRGGFEVSGQHYRWMVVLHTLWLFVPLLEVWWLQRPLRLTLALAMLAMLCLTMALRYWAIATLGDRWTTQIYVVPGEEPVRRGPYRVLRHPNYVAVALEVPALPLLHGAWISAVVFSVLNLWLLATRIAAEERALSAHSDYQESFQHLPRFLPKAGSVAGARSQDGSST